MSWQFDPRNSWSWLWFNQIKHREVEVERLQYYCTAVWSWECIETLLNEFKAYQAYDQVCQKDWHSPKIKKVHFNWGKHLYKQLFLWRINRKPWILNNRFRDCSKTIEKSAFKKWISVCVRAMTCECSFVTLRYLRLLKSSQVAISQNPARLSHQRSWCGCSPTFQWAAWPLEDLVTWTSFMPCSLKPTKAYNYVHS